MRKLLFGLVIAGTLLAAACGEAATPTPNPTARVPSAATLPPAVPTSAPDPTTTPTPDPTTTPTPESPATATPLPTPEPTPTPPATPTTAPTVTTAPEPTPTEEPDAMEPAPTPTPEPTLEPTPTSAPLPTETPLPTLTPVPAVTTAPSPTPVPTATQEPPPTSTTHQVNITGSLTFSPADVTIQPGDTVNWTTTGSVHTTTSGAPGGETGVWKSDVLQNRQSFSFTFNEEGEFLYFCSIHPFMRGTVAVVSNGQVSTSEGEPSPTEPSPAGYGGLAY